MTVQGTRIRERRCQLNMSQAELAARIGSSQRQISKYENTINDPTGDVLAALAKALETTTDWLLGLASSPDRYVQTEQDLSEIEKELLYLYRSKAVVQRELISKIVRIL